MKTRIWILLIICFSLASLLVAEESTMITGREKRNQAKDAGGWDDWNALTLPGMDEVLVASNKFNFDFGWGKEWEVAFDIYYPPNYNFKSKLPTVFISHEQPQYKSSISFGQLIAASGLIAVIPDISSYKESFGVCINHCLKNAGRYEAEDLRIIQLVCG